jgi:hypothetical protein
MHGHLIAIEVRIEGSAHQRMDFNRLAFHQDWFKGLNA